MTSTPSKSTKPKEKMTIYLTRDIKRALKVEAAERRTSASEVIEEALQSRIVFLPRALRPREET